MSSNNILSALFIRNRDKLSKLIPEGMMAILNSNDLMPRNGDLPFAFRQQSDLYYLTGIIQEGTVLIMFPSHPKENMREIVFSKDPDPVAEQWYGHILTRQEIQEISGIKHIRGLSEFEGFLSRLMTEAEGVMLNLNEYPKFSTEVPYRDLRFARMMRERYPLHRFDRLAPIMAGLRMVKEEQEIDLIRNALAITNDTFYRVLEFIKPGVMEYEVQAEMVHEMIRQGSTGPAYPPIIGSGRNACVLHYMENRDQCKEGDLLLMDFGADHAYYAADVSRTIPVSGRFNKRQRQLYDIVHRVMLRSREYYIPGETIDSINRKAKLLMAEELAGIGILKRDDVCSEAASIKAVQPYMVHGIAHHLGIDVHDIVLPDAPLQAGMVLTCEPGLYLMEENTGIRIENDIVVGDTFTDLCEGIPSEAEEIEALILSKY